MAGRPESYFRKPDQHLWARRFGVPIGSDGSIEHRAFVAGAARVGTTPNGVFAARIMWGSMLPIVDGLNPDRVPQSDLDVLLGAFGPLILVHLRREDVVGQAVSWARAEQTGYWQQGDAPLADPHFDLDQVDDLVRTVQEDNAAWSTWFSKQGAKPYVVTYEDVVADPRGAVEGILNRLEVEVPSGWRPNWPHRRQADEVNAEWVRRYRITRG